MIKIIGNDFSIEKYNEKAFHPLQSWQWGEARKKMGIEMLRIGEFNNNQLESVFQVTFHEIPYTAYKLGYLPRSVFPSSKVLNYLEEYAKKNKVIFIKLEPYEKKENFKFQTRFARRVSNFKLIKSPHPLFPSWTQIIDLMKPEEELLKQMKSKTRYNIRLAQKKGVTVKEESTDEGFKKFIELYFDTCRRQKYFGHNREYHKTVWENLKNDIGHILIAYYEGKPLAAYELFNFNHRFYYPYGGTALKQRNLMAANLIMWEAIRLGKKLGAKEFDMWGSLSPNYDENHPWAGFTRFKEGYGSKFAEFIGSYDLIIKPIHYSIYSQAYKLREILLKLKEIY